MKWFVLMELNSKQQINKLNLKDCVDKMIGEICHLLLQLSSFKIMLYNYNNLLKNNKLN